MSELLQKLQDWGCNIEKAKERFLDDEELYESCLLAFSADEGFEQLEKNLKEKDYQAAFDSVHTLKGVAANLELAPLLEKLSALTELLRANNYEGLEEPYNELVEKYHIFCSFL